MSPNLERMLKLVDEFFAMKNDPEQLNVNEAVMEKLRAMHPATLSEKADENGPIAWILLIPTTKELMDRFLAKGITEQQLFEMTPTKARYDALYLCSALVLPEYRGRGIACAVANDAIRAIRQDHPVAHVFYWAFSEEGDRLAVAVGRGTGLPVYKKPE